MGNVKLKTKKIGVLLGFIASLFGLSVLNPTQAIESQNCAFNKFTNDGVRWYDGEDCYCVGYGDECVFGGSC